MTTEAFISYAHRDDASRERLHKHLATLRRDGLLRAWSDHDIMAGDKLGPKIQEALAKSGLFLALLSPDYLASNYCYDIEFKRAQELEAAGQMRIVGIVVEPCDRKNSPFGDGLVLPKDGKAVPDWTNENNAYLNVAEGLRRMLEASAGKTSAAAPETKSASPRPAKRLRVKQDFDTIQKGEFADKAYELMRGYFESACAELLEASEHIRSEYGTMSKTAFTCTIVNRAKMRGGDAHITVHRNKGQRMSAGDISYVYAPHAEGGTSNGWLSVHANEYELFLQGTIGHFGISQDKGWTPQAAAEGLWNVFMQQAGLEFES